jgi:hypothetical protein
VVFIIYAYIQQGAVIGFDTKVTFKTCDVINVDNCGANIVRQKEVTTGHEYDTTILPDDKLSGFPIGHSFSCFSVKREENETNLYNAMDFLIVKKAYVARYDEPYMILAGLTLAGCITWVFYCIDESI